MKSNSTWWLVAFPIALPFCALGVFMTWGQPANEKGSGGRSNILQPYRLTWNWTTEKWSSSDAPFAQIQSEVDAVEKARQLDVTYLKVVQQRADNSPQDAKAQFRWAYAMLRAPYAGIQLRPGAYSDYEDVVRAYERPASPRSYLYSRVRFLIMTLNYENPPLKIVGKRLLQRNSNDTPVKSSLVGYFSYSRDLQERKLALKYAHELIAKHPTWQGAYAIIAGVYTQQLFDRGDIAAADKGVAAWRTYISLLKPDQQNYREGASMAIRMLQEEKARQQKQGFKISAPKD